MIAQNNARIQVTLSKDMLATLDKYCDLMGVTRSQFVSARLGEILIGLEGGINAVYRRGKDVEQVTIQDAIENSSIRLKNGSVIQEG